MPCKNCHKIQHNTIQARDEICRDRDRDSIRPKWNAMHVGWEGMNLMRLSRKTVYYRRRRWSVPRGNKKAWVLGGVGKYTWAWNMGVGREKELRGVQNRRLGRKGCHAYMFPEWFPPIRSGSEGEQ